MSDGAIPHPTDLLPHRAPFLLLDEITELVPGQLASGTWRLTGDEWFFPGHFPGRPTLPGVLMLESLAQTGACGVLSDPRFTGRIPLLAGSSKVRFRRQVVPGETLDLRVELTRLTGRAGKGEAVASVNGETACQAELMFVLADG
ncbi:MAG: 3-hydroxyacyl-ACP dehydratase FabZ [Acidimicrobiia bacterium]|nr:3-hydroxyacyl-ACP dehydratase FabZ [Acidimicrobiia bacterium]